MTTCLPKGPKKNLFQLWKLMRQCIQKIHYLKWCMLNASTQHDSRKKKKKKRLHDISLSLFPVQAAKDPSSQFTKTRFYNDWPEKRSTSMLYCITAFQKHTPLTVDCNSIVFSILSTSSAYLEVKIIVEISNIHDMCLCWMWSNQIRQQPPQKWSHNWIDISQKV